MSNPTQTITVTIQVTTGTNAVSHALSYIEQQYTITGDHKALMAGFKSGTTPAVIKALEDSCIIIRRHRRQGGGEGGSGVK